jgi:hypothetical protein
LRSPCLLRELANAWSGLRSPCLLRELANAPLRHLLGLATNPLRQRALAQPRDEAMKEGTREEASWWWIWRFRSFFREIPVGKEGSPCYRLFTGQTIESHDPQNTHRADRWEPWSTEYTPITWHLFAVNLSQHCCVIHFELLQFPWLLCVVVRHYTFYTYEW